MLVHTAVEVPRPRSVLLVLLLLSVAPAQGTGTLLVLGYDDSLLPADQGSVEVVVNATDGSSRRYEVRGGWATGLDPEQAQEAFPGAAELGAGWSRAARVLVPGTGEREVHLVCRRADRLGEFLGLDLWDRLRSAPRAVTLPAQPGEAVELFLGPLQQDTIITRVRIEPPIFDPREHPAVPFFTMHHRQAEQVLRLTPYQGGAGRYNLVYPQPDGSWLYYHIGPGSFTIGAYSFGYGEHRSTGLVVRKADAHHTQELRVEPLLMLPLRWAILVLEVDATVPVERCLGVKALFQPLIYARDPGSSGASLDQINLHPIYSLEPTHPTWLRGRQQLPAPEVAPFSMLGNQWQPAFEEIQKLLQEQAERARRTAPLQVQRCLVEGREVDGTDHEHEASLETGVVTEPAGVSVLTFIGTAQDLASLSLLIKGGYAVRGSVLPEGDLSPVLLDHDLLTGDLRPEHAAEVRAREVHLTPLAVTRYRVLVDPTGAQPAATEVRVSEPLPIPPLERYLQAPEAGLERHLRLPPHLEPTTETVTFTFPEPVEGTSIVVDLGPAEHLETTTPSIEVAADQQVATATYEVTRLPAGVRRTVTLRRGVQPVNRLVGPLRESLTWVVQEGGELVRQTPPEEEE